MKHQPGDLILYKVTKRSALFALAIAAGERLLEIFRGQPLRRVQYRHVAILEDDQHKIEATWPKVRRAEIDWTDPSIEVYRVINASHDKGDSAVAYARNCIGEWYDLGEILFGLFRSSHRKICSRLVDDSWMSQGIELLPETDAIVTPDEIAASKVLMRLFDV
jgi:hypothetical protein